MSSLEVLFNLDAINTVALLAVVFIGLPHGAMDGALAVHFGWMKRPSSALAFLLAYVGLAAVVVWLWSVSPVLSFVAFLAIILSTPTEAGAVSESFSSKMSSLTWAFSVTWVRSFVSCFFRNTGLPTIGILTKSAGD